MKILDKTTKNKYGRYGIMGIGDIASKYGIHRNTASLWTKRTGFPQPLFVLSGILGFQKNEVEEWVKSWMKVNQHPSRNQLKLRKKGN
jgi:predicted DNA-binding transcriptional regulator AlpA